MVRLRLPATLLLLACLLLPVDATGGRAPLTAPPEQLEALFVQRLVHYVTWPAGARPDAAGPVVVAATDARSLQPYFADVPDSAFRLVQYPADPCHVLVVTGVPEREAAAILRQTAGRPVLTIGDGPAALRFGAVVAFRRVGDRIRLEVNPRAAARAGLSISSRLLAIVRIYGGDHE